MTPSLSSSLPNLEAFCRTYEAGSFSVAARQLGVTPQATSRAVARLEEVLGTTLFRRTTRKLAPTEAARRYYHHCSRALALLADGERALSHPEGEPRGDVRISVPTTYGHHRLLPSLAVFAERYPRIRVEVGISNGNADLVADGFDLAIRRAPVHDRTLVARSLGDFTVGVYASGEYLARRGTPRVPADLAAHECVSFVMPSSGRVLPWTFAGRVRFAPQGRYRCADDVVGVVALARVGIGLVQVLEFLVAGDLARGSLVEVLAAHRGPARSFVLLYPKAAKPTPAARALIDFVVATAASDRSPGRPA